MKNYDVLTSFRTQGDLCYEMTTYINSNFFESEYVLVVIDERGDLKFVEKFDRLTDLDDRILDLELQLFNGFPIE